MSGGSGKLRCNMRAVVVLVLSVLSALGSRAVWAAQAAPGSEVSLLDLAKKERERREQTGEAVRVISNADLVGLKHARVIVSRPRGTAASVANQVTEAEAPQDEEEAVAEEATDLEFWRNAFQEARTNLANAVNRAMVLELRMNNLRNAFLQTSDGVTRERIEAEMAKTFQDLAQAREDEKAARQALSDLERQAARAGVQPGTIRELVGELPESGSSMEGVPVLREDAMAPAQP